MVNCLPCVSGYHSECWIPTEEGLCHCHEDTPPVVIHSDETKERGGQLKDRADVTDWESTGRKRAAKLYPLNRENDCEWKGLKLAGGGPVPILGCLAGKQEAIHHGPDKNTLSNFVGNVHRICHTCHNRWHTLNDSFYPSERPNGDTPFIPVGLGEIVTAHDGLTKFNPEEFAANEMMWLDRKGKKNGNANTKAIDN
jgi:hypothetical protein